MLLKTSALTAILLIGLSCACLGEVRSELPLPFLPRDWQVTPEVEAELAAMRANDTYRPNRATTRVFVRAQLKYGLERDDYLHRWYDRPLMGDVRSAAADEKGHTINVESWKRMAELGKLCGHGFAAFTISSGREDILSRSVLPGYESEVLVETVMGGPSEDGFSNKFRLCLQRIEEALAATNTFRINGHLIVTSYPQIRIDRLANYRAFKAEVSRRWGDRVALMPYFTPFALETNRTFDKNDLEKTKENLRTVLRETDGLCLALGSSIGFNRRTDPRFAVEVAAPIVRSVLSEPEFRGKPFGLMVACGHENCYRWNYAQDCTGTKRLRDHLAMVRAMRPDFINATEWDEENENTQHRPTVALGFVHSRLLRYASSELEGRPQAVWPGDDTSVPNLVLSYRKALLAGEPIEAEVLNIPDGTFGGETFTVQLRWKNAAGVVVKSYPPQQLAADELKAVWFVSPATELLAEPLLRPELAVKSSRGRQFFSRGFWPLSLHANRSVEFRWVKQALREKTLGVTSALAVSEPEADGTVTVTGEVSSPEELRSVEVLDGPDTVCLYDPAAPDRDADGSMTVKVAWQGLPWNRDIRLDGSIRLEGVSTAAFAEPSGYWGPVFREDRAIRFKGAAVTAWPRAAYVKLSAAEIETAAFAVDLPPYFTGRMTAKELLRKDIHAFSADGGMNVVLRRWTTPVRLSPPCGGKSAKFSFRMKPSTPDSVLRLQTVDARFHVDYGDAQTFYRPSGRAVTVRTFERDEETVGSAVVDANRLTPFDYTFSPARGGVVMSGTHLGLGGIFCGYTPLVCGYGGAESADGNVILEHGISAQAPGWPKTSPAYVKESDGSWSLRFADANFVTLPQQIVPQQAGFTLEVEVNPDEVVRKQGLFTSGANYFELGIANGRVFAQLFLRNGYFRPDARPERIVWGPEIRPGRWSTVRVSWDRATCRVGVDGEWGEPVAVSGDLFYARHSALGVLHSNETFFKGRIRRLRVGF